MNRILVLYESKTGHIAIKATHVAEVATQIAGTEVRGRAGDEAVAHDQEKEKMLTATGGCFRGR